MHQAAIRILRSCQQRRWGRVHTTDFVVAEALNYLRARNVPPAAEAALVALAIGRPDRPPIVDRWQRIHGQRFHQALEIFPHYRDQGLSLTDCSSLYVMHQEQIGTLATFDSGFQGLVPTVGLDP